MLQDFPAETAVVRAKKVPPKLEGFYSEKARALEKLLALDKALAAKKAMASQKAAAPKKPAAPDTPGLGARRLALDGRRTFQLALDGLRSSMTFAVPVLVVVAAIAFQPLRESTDVVLPTRQGNDIVLPAQPLASQPQVRGELNPATIADAKISSAPAGISPVPLYARPAPARAIANPNESQPALVSTIAEFNQAQSVATSLQERLGAPVDAPAPLPAPQQTQVSTLGTAPGAARRPIEPPSERVDAAPIVIQQSPADPTPAIREVIRRYEAAYERLDASAAKEIWPSLDERALARAFSGLASQTLRLEACNIDVTGSSAVASCHGVATYVGRVGNRMGQVQRRDWTFELRKSTDNWQIRSVRSN